VAEGNRTLWVAVAGIAATALVGLAGTTAAWLSARDDRATQRELAGEQRSYDRRVAVYLDAIDFVERQRRAIERYGGYVDVVGPGEAFKGTIWFEQKVPARLESRLRAFSSTKAFKEFQKVERVVGDMPISVDFRKGRTFIPTGGGSYDGSYDAAIFRHYPKLLKQIHTFERTLRDEVG
jgi:hypothetical protein